MSEFARDNLGWQIQQLQQKVSQWWEWQFRQFNPDLPNIKTPDWDWLDFLWLTVKNIMIVLLVTLIIWAMWRIWLLLRPYFYDLQRQSFQRYQQAIQADISVGEWLERSQKYQRQGDYYQACRHIYLAMLQHLHERGLIPHQSSRTDGEYLELILRFPQPTAYQTLLDIHQRLCFGSQLASPSLLQTCQVAYQDIVNGHLVKSSDSPV
jgi:hypothetical protein